MANCIGCGSQWDNKQTAPVGSFSPNKFGLYDIVGNVQSWVEDCHHPDYADAPRDGSEWRAGCPDNITRVVRGGSWVNAAGALRSVNRMRYSADFRGDFLGFRVGRTLTP
jgi:formylglycine-generating enzyme required for sulfatase activity